MKKIFHNKPALSGIVFFSIVVVIFCVVYFAIPTLFATKYERANVSFVTNVAETLVLTPTEKAFTASHLSTPVPLKAIYMTSWVAGTKSIRNKLVELIDTTEINSVVIDIKDYTGRISFQVDDPYLKEIDAVENRIPDIRDFLETLHKKNIYVIGRISAFQDPHFVKIKPEIAVKRKSDGEVWKDYKGISWIDAGSKEIWDYLVALGKESYRIGFDELNFDYIRFPSDGNMKDIAYPESGGKPKAEVLREFFAYLNTNLKPTGHSNPSGQVPVLSADLFGMTTTNTDDLNIGQVLENALPYFDYISPMVYPSHYPLQFMGFSNPAEKPYEVVKFSMDSAVRRAIATTTVVIMYGEEPISTTTKSILYKKISFDAKKIRPWLQDFNLGATYTATMVKSQIQATYDAGLDSWMLWNASNKYTKEALKKEGEVLTEVR